MAHAVSALYSKFNRMSPAAAAMAALLHAAVALAFLLELPRTQAEAAEQAIEFTVDAPVPAPPESQPQQAAAAPPPPAAQPPSVPPSPPPAPAPRLGLAPPRSLTPDPTSRPDVPPGPTSTRPTRTTEPTREAAREPAREPPKPEPPKPEPEQQQAAAAPPPPPPPPEMKLEQALPPLDAPPPPLSAQDFPKVAPPPPPKAPPPPPPQQRAQTPPPPQQRQPLQPSPLGGQQQRPPADAQAAARPAPSPLTNPASQYGQRKAEEDYLWRVAQKLSQHQQFVKNVTTESGSVVMRFIIARDGSLVDVGIFKSSGLPSLDASAISMFRQAAPYPPLPADITGARQSFLLPLQFRRSD